MAEAEQYGDEAEESQGLAGTVDDPSDDAVTLWVCLVRGDRLVGSVGDQTQTGWFSFHGWIAFMAAINTLRGSARGP